MMRAFAVLVCGGLVACGGGGTPSAPKASTTIVAPPASPDDVQVATVNGRPVWGSCVARQASSGKAREVAVRECIDFELLSQLAEERALASDPEVREALHTALVDRVVALGYEQKFTEPADFGTAMVSAVAARDRQRSRPAMRSSTYLRVTIDPPTPAQMMDPSDPREAAARAIAERLAAKLAPETGLLSASLLDAAEPFRAEAAAARLKIDHSDTPFYAAVGLDKAYADALFAIAEVGRTSGPVRTPWGWDVILYTGAIAPFEQTRDELARELLPAVKREYFPVWVKQLAQAMGATITYDETNLARLAEDDS